MMSTTYLWVMTSILTFQVLVSEPQNYRAYSLSNVVINENPIKEKALKILQNKCNVCHKKKNPFMVFKLKNMDKRSNKIYNQVFIKKRMPKGNKITLTTGESQELLTWLNSTKKNKNGNKL